jgi:hypothetical protein
VATAAENDAKRKKDKRREVMWVKSLERLENGRAPSLLFPEFGRLIPSLAARGNPSPLGKRIISGLTLYCKDYRASHPPLSNSKEGVRPRPDPSS